MLSISPPKRPSRCVLSAVRRPSAARTAWSSLALCAMLVPAAYAQATRYIFATSVSGGAELSSWSDAGGLSGLEAADAICQARAQAASLEDPEEYVAWLSDSHDDAYCRIHGLSGKKANNCGQETLPKGAGPWVRRDGRVVGRRIERMLDNGEVLVPVLFDEYGQRVSGRAFTATDREGAAGSTTCDDWTSTESEGYVKLGVHREVARSWGGGYFAGSCSSEENLLCMYRGTGGKIATEPAPGRLAFVTEALFDGNFAALGSGTGVAVADAMCRSEATAAGLPAPGSFKAWLSTAGQDAIDRFANDGPWVRTDGVQVFFDKAHLRQGEPIGPLNVTATGEYVPSAWDVWTGTLDDGSAAEARCSDWSSSSSSVLGNVGLVGDVSWWSDEPNQRKCSNTSYRLYCLSDTAFEEQCMPNDGTLCLGADGRFRVRMTFDGENGEEPAHTVEIGKRDSGLFYFYNDNNIEVLMKVLNGCSSNQRYWVFYAATTNAGFHLTVEDLLRDESVEYSNPDGMVALPETDLQALATCP